MPPERGLYIDPSYWEPLEDREPCGDQQQEVDRLRAALERIHGHFIKGERNTYAPAAQTLDEIRIQAAEALGLPTPTEDEVLR